MSAWLGRGCPDILATITLSVSARMSLDEINDLTFSSRLSKAECPPQCGWASSNQLKAWTEHVGSVKGNSYIVSTHLPTYLPSTSLENPDWYRCHLHCLQAFKMYILNSWSPYHLSPRPVPNKWHRRPIRLGKSWESHPCLAPLPHLLMVCPPSKLPA